MAGSAFGTIFRITTWGESHGKGIGLVVEGCPAGMPLCEEDINRYLARRRPGGSPYHTERREEDRVEILSGVFEGKTTGTPISLFVKNTDQRPGDYDALKEIYRPGHADFCYDAKYGFRDHRGGGRASGRETLARVAGGAVAARVLEEIGIRLFAYTRSIGEISVDPGSFSPEERDLNPLFMPDKEAATRALSLIDEYRTRGDSLGGVVECLIRGVPAGLGDPVFDKLSALLGRGILSIGGVRGFEMGDGFGAALSAGSVQNDPFENRGGIIRKKTNHAGGIQGGISDGSDIIFRAAFKPVSSIALEQETVDREGKPARIHIEGRHDPVIAPRAVVVVETMAACVILDRLLVNMSSRLDRVKDFYRRWKN